jgi:hypothetical protein
VTCAWLRRIGWFTVTVAAIGGCSHGSRAAHGPSTTRQTNTTSSTGLRPSAPGRATAQLEVTSHTVTAGAAVKVVLVIENRTGKPIIQPQCHDTTDWQAFLTNGVVASGPLPVRTVRRLCDPKVRTNLPGGETRLTFTTDATFFGCAPSAESYPPTPRCLRGDRMPPLPVGLYRLDTNVSPYIGVPKAAPVNMRVVSP